LHGVNGRVLRVRLGGVHKVSLHHIILAGSLPEPFEVARERSGVGVCEDVVQLRQDVRGISLERLLRNRPVCHRKQQCILLENGERGEGGEEQPIDIER
jgi:hypothetical protein